jgi:hypothetical protein
VLRLNFYSYLAGCPRTNFVNQPLTCLKFVCLIPQKKVGFLKTKFSIYAVNQNFVHLPPLYAVVYNIWGKPEKSRKCNFQTFFHVQPAGKSPLLMWWPGGGKNARKISVVYSLGDPLQKNFTLALATCEPDFYFKRTIE